VASLWKSTSLRWTAAAVLGTLVTLGVVLLVRRPAETLTPARLHAAERRWQASGIRDYAMRLVVSGVQKGVHQVRVRDGRVVAMTTGGAPVAEHVWQQWSVEGMFAFLQQELENAQDPENAYSIADPSHVVLQVGFDEQFGYPRHFLRHVMGRRASIEWEVEEFERD
jgi:hypothetical protein